jgi:CRISPR-associated protein Csm3
MSAPAYFQRHLKAFLKIDVEFENKTGLLIRASLPIHAYRIGAADQYPMTTMRYYTKRKEWLEVPYIPGSSFKGRMRSLLELALKKKLYTTDKKIWQHVRNLSAMSLDDFLEDVLNRCVVDELFGYAGVQYAQIAEKAEKEKKAVNLNQLLNQLFGTLAVTRLLVDDFYPTEEYVEQINAKFVSDFLEEKSENRIDRITSAADPRDIVRVKPGVRFVGRLTLLLFDHDNEMVENYLAAIATGLKLVEETYLGASGSRGYGRVSFKKIDVSLEKVIVEGETPKLVEVPEVKKSYGSVDEFENGVKDLANLVRKEVFT